MDGFLLRHTDRQQRWRWRGGEGVMGGNQGEWRWRKAKEVLWLLKGLSLTTGQEMHSDPVIDLTTGVNIETLSHTHLY